MAGTRFDAGRGRRAGRGTPRTAIFRVVPWRRWTGMDIADRPQHRLRASQEAEWSSRRVSGLQDRERLTSALAALPIEQRECLVLCELEQLSYKDIARIAQVPIGTVMSRLSRARSALMRIPLAGVSHGERESVLV